MQNLIVEIHVINNTQHITYNTKKYACKIHKLRFLIDKQETYIRLKCTKLVNNLKENACSIECFCSTPEKWRK